MVRFRPEALVSFIRYCCYPFYIVCNVCIVAGISHADLAHLVERHLAKVEVASSSLVIRSIFGAIAKW